MNLQIVTPARIAFLVLIVAASAHGQSNLANPRVQSPDGRLNLSLGISQAGQPTFQVARDGRAIILPSRLGVRYAQSETPTTWKSLVTKSHGYHYGIWEPVWGERSQVVNRYHSATIGLSPETQDEDAPPMEIELRAYNEGVAFRYMIRAPRLRIASEATEFRFAGDHPVWAVSSAQGKYSQVALSQLKHPVERPCVLEANDGQFIAIAEAGLVDYARMRLRRSKDKENTLAAVLHNQDKALPVVYDSLPHGVLKTPWRVIMVGDSPGELLENNDLLLNLNAPCRIKDVDWIRPGKVIREVTLSTQGAKACVDFAVKYGMQFIEFDAGWYGPERDANSDATTVSKRGLDLQEALDYAKQNGIGVIVYVNRRHLERQLDELLPLYKRWGIAGIKYGFVQHGSQKWTAWMHDAIRKTADHEIMVDVHDEYRMSGWQRTYPNFMTAEGIGGDETRPSHEQVLTNLFTRMLASPADHTFCYYNRYVDATSSHASQLAKMVCFFSPWQFVFWYDQPKNAHDELELQFIKQLPTTWDDTRVIEGKIGSYATIARRKGDDWFVGCLNAGEARPSEIPLEFLNADTTYVAEIYRDDESVASKTHVGIERRQVDSTTIINVDLAAPGGMAMRIVPQSSERESRRNQ